MNEEHPAPQPPSSHPQAPAGSVPATREPWIDDGSTGTLVPPAPQPRPTLRRFFRGDDGLRAGWSVLLFFVFIAAITVAIVKVRAHLHHAAPAAAAQNVITPWHTIVGEAVSLAVVLLAAWLVSLIEPRRFSRYGFALGHALSDLLQGLLWGLAMLSLLVGMLYLTHALSFDGIVLHGTAALTYALRWGLAFLLVAFFEEFFFRGFLQYTVSRGVAGITRSMDPQNRHSYTIGFWVAAFLFSILLFSVAHISNNGETLVGILAVSLAGITFVYAIWRTGTLWWAIGFHATWDWAQSYLYGTADSGQVTEGHLLATHPIGSATLSGGTAGPEGSIFVLPTLLLTMLVIHLTLPRRPVPRTPDQTPLPEPNADAIPLLPDQMD